MTTLEALESVILPRGFVKLDLDNPTLVYGKIVKPNITFRIYSNCEKDGSKKDIVPFLLKFVTKQEGKIVKIGSERRVATHQFAREVWQENLINALNEWETQLREVDEICNKCDGDGKYCWTSKNGNECEGQCNRCGGRGYQDFTDRRKNIAYDRHVEDMAKRVGEDTDGEIYSDWIPHWVPDPKNFRDKNWRQKAHEKKRE